MISTANKLAAAAVLGLLAGTTSAQTETQTQYVIEQLFVSVNAAPDGSGERVGQIKSGDHVEVLERQGDQTHVRIASGEEGWVRASYLSSTPPLRDQLKARTDELEKLRQEKTRLEADLAAARKSPGVAADAAASVAPSSPAPESGARPVAAISTAPAESSPPEVASVDAAQPSNPPLFSSESVMPSRPSWLVALIGSVAALVIGFALGWRVLDRRIRARYGGLRIY